MKLSLTYLATDGSGEAALRLRPDDSETRVDTHFTMLLDISESMADANKLNNVKHCMSLLLQFLAPTDELSIVTFGEESKIVLNRLKMSGGGATATAEQTIRALHVQGCTNLSAGLASVREVLDDAAASGSTLKQGLFILTDGHANRGVSDPGALRGMVSRIHEIYPALTISFVAYGVDHNTDLLKGMAQDCMGAYSVVESTEDAALTMGEALGSVTSCVAQNVIVQCPAGTTVLGPYKISEAGELRIGDMYAGVETMLLLNLKEGPVRVRGSLMPSMDPFNTEVTDRSLTLTRNLDIYLTRLRYTCSDLWERMRAGRETEAILRPEIDSLRDALADTELDGNAVAEMLRGEIPSLIVALEERGRGAGARVNVLASQHAAFTSLGRGTSQPITQAALYQTNYNYYGVAAAAVPPGYGTDDEDEDPSGALSMAPGAPRETSYLSPTSSAPARRVAAAMRVSSQTTPAPAAPGPRVRFNAPSSPSAAPPAPLGRTSSMPN